MKKLLTLVMVVALAGCVTAHPVKYEPLPAQEVKLKIEGPEVVKETASYVPELSALSQIIGDTAYFALWAGIETTDALYLWKDCNIFRQQRIKKLHIYLNSPGGSPFDGLAIATTISYLAKTGKFDITVEASGLVASAAVPILVAAPYRIAASGTIFMIHSTKLVKFFAYEGEKDLIAQQKMMEIERKRYTRLLADHSKLTQEEIEKMCEKTTWFTAEQAKKWGMIDEIR